MALFSDASPSLLLFSAACVLRDSLLITHCEGHRTGAVSITEMGKHVVHKQASKCIQSFSASWRRLCLLPCTPTEVPH